MMKRIREESLVHILLAVVVLVFAVSYGYNLGGYLISDDEGSFLYQVWRITEGERPYRDFFSSRWPLFLYSGAAWMHVFGAGVVQMRSLAVLLTLGAAIVLFVMAREVFSSRIALLGAVIFMAHPDVFCFGRLFHPEPFYVFFATLGLCLFVRGHTRGSVAWIAGAGFALAVASMYKLIAVLVLAGCVLYLAVSWVRRRDARRVVVLRALALLLSCGALYGLVTVWFLTSIPEAYDGVIGVNLAHGSALTVQQVVLKGLVFFLEYALNYALLILLASFAAWQGWRGDQRLALFGWQLPTVAAFLLLSRALYPRLLLYLVPVLCVLFAAALDRVRLALRRSWIYSLAVGLLLVPWVVSNARQWSQRDPATMIVSRHVQAYTSAGDGVVLSDYQEINFHARRRSTYSGAELSRLIVECGQVTAADLIVEIEAAGVEVVVVDVGDTAHHMMNLVDYADLRDHLGEHFVLRTVLQRGAQKLEIYVREGG